MKEHIISLMMSMASGCASGGAPADDWPLHQLTLVEETRLTPPEGVIFQASGLTWDAEGRLLTVDDRQAAVYQIVPSAGTNGASLVVLHSDIAEARRIGTRGDEDERFDAEGIAEDEQGRLYLCEESERNVWRLDPTSGDVERLDIDWSPVRRFFNGLDRNAAFEGIAVEGGRLYLANERSDPVIVVVDLASRKVIDHFVVRPRTLSFFGMHYSGLAAHQGRLFVLLRQHRVVLEVDLQTKRVLAEYDYRAAEDALGYVKDLPVGIMEGLAVDDEFLWLVNDSNLKPRQGTDDTRPTLLKFRRPRP